MTETKGGQHHVQVSLTSPLPDFSMASNKQGLGQLADKGAIQKTWRTSNLTYSNYQLDCETRCCAVTQIMVQLYPSSSVTRCVTADVNLPDSGLILRLIKGTSVLLPLSDKNVHI